jgi:transcriptional regulator with XRE-family HTH domain
MGTLPSIDMRATGDNIMRMRRRMGMTVQDLKNIFGFSTPQAIYKWQRGTAMPTLDNLVVLATVFGTTMGATPAASTPPMKCLRVVM